MGFLRWAFSGTMRHRKNIQRYENSIGSKVAMFVIALVFAGATIFFEIWGFNSFATSFGLGIVGFILSFAFAGATLDFALVFCYVAFRTAALGGVESIAERLDRKNAEKKGIEYIPPQKTKAKQHRWVDILFGFLFLALAIGLVVGIVLCIGNHFANL